MPELIHIGEFNNGTRDPRQYFVDAYTRGYGNEARWIFNVDKSYPYICYIHSHRSFDIIEGEAANRIMIGLRKFAQRQASGDIIISYESKDFHWCWNANEAKGSFDRKYSEVRNRYWVLNFEFKEDLLAWKLSTTDVPFTDKMLDRLPEYDEKDCSKYPYTIQVDDVAVLCYSLGR